MREQRLRLQRIRDGNAACMVPRMERERKLSPSEPHFLDTTDEALRQWLETRHIPRYRVDQIWQGLCGRRANAFAELTDIPLAVRQELTESYALWAGATAQHTSADDGTEKLLIRYGTSSFIECVLLRDGIRRTICISTQVGCAMGCVFCASGLHGVERNLTTGEILEQVLRLQQRLPREERLSHVVVMGMGEPLANLDRLLPALDRVRHRLGLGISPRRITISTVGLPDGIDRLAAMKSRYQLAISLHAPSDDLRNQLVPVNDRIGVAAIVAAADRYQAATGQRITWEYVLLREVNDGIDHARALVGLLGGRNALLNVIPYNPVPGLPYRTPSALSVRRFREVLQRGGINVQFRERKGNAIQAACGQLRRTVATTALALE